MNKARREEIAKAIALLEEAKDLLTNVQQEEQDAFDNMPEGLQQGERGQKSEEAIDNLDSAVAEIQSAIDTAESAAE